MTDSERFCAKQRQVSKTSWIEKIRERLDTGKPPGMTDITTKTGGCFRQTRAWAITHTACRRWGA